MKTILLFLSFFTLPSSCETDEVESNFQATELIFTDVGSGSLYGDEGIQQSNLVLNNQTEWQNLLTQVNAVSPVSDNFEETTIDFESYTVIAVFLEIKPTSWGIEVTSVFENENDILVSNEETEGDATILSQPFHIVKIPKTTKDIVFE